MTPAEQVRAEVEAWERAHCNVECESLGVGDVERDDLIARLTPVFERAQALDGERGRHLLAECDLHVERDALRERAERAEAEAREMSARNVAGNEQLSVEILRREAAEADVARLREALEDFHVTTCLESQNRQDVCCSVVDLLASTEPKP